MPGRDFLEFPGYPSPKCIWLLERWDPMHGWTAEVARLDWVGLCVNMMDRFGSRQDMAEAFGCEAVDSEIEDTIDDWRVGRPVKVAGTWWRWWDVDAKRPKGWTAMGPEEAADGQ